MKYKLFFLFFLGCKSVLVADEIKILDGSIIQGTILGMDDGNLTILTEFAGKINIPENQIDSFASQKILSFRMDDNRTLSGIVRFEEDGNFTLEDQGERFSPSSIKHLWSDDMDDPLISAAQKQAEELLLKWEHSLGVDLAGSSGNSENFGLGIRLDSNLGNKLRGYDIYLSYNKADKKNTPIVDETKFGLEYDSRFFEALSWYVKTDLENDKLEEIDLRATSSLGLKYSWIDEIDYQLSLRSGMAFKYEKSSHSSLGDQNDPAIDLGLEYEHKIKDMIILESDLSYVPSLDEFEDFLISKDTALVFSLSKDLDWHLRSGLSGTYNSTPVEDNEELDLRYYIRLVYQFK